MSDGERKLNWEGHRSSDRNFHRVSVRVPTLLVLCKEEISQLKGKNALPSFDPANIHWNRQNSNDG